MSSCNDLNANKELSASYESPSESELFEEPIGLDHVSQDNKDSTEAQDMVRKQAAWRLRNLTRQTRMFHLRRAGELVMGATIASLGTYATAQSLGEGSIEGTAISIFGIIWSLGVGREVFKDLNSPEYMDMAYNLAQEQRYHDATMALLEIKFEPPTI